MRPSYWPNALMECKNRLAGKISNLSNLTKNWSEVWAEKGRKSQQAHACCRYSTLILIQPAHIWKRERTSSINWENIYSHSNTFCYSADISVSPRSLQIVTFREQKTICIKKHLLSRQVNPRTRILVFENFRTMVTRQRKEVGYGYRV